MATEHETYPVSGPNGEEIDEPMRVGGRVIYPNGKITDAQTGETLVDANGRVRQQVGTDSDPVDVHGGEVTANEIGADYGTKSDILAYFTPIDQSESTNAGPEVLIGNDSNTSKHLLELHRGDDGIMPSGEPILRINSGGHIKSGASAAFWNGKEALDYADVADGDSFTLALKADGDFPTMPIDSVSAQEGADTPVVRQRRDDSTAVYHRYPDGSKWRLTTPYEKTRSPVDLNTAGQELVGNRNSFTYDGGTSDHAIEPKADDVVVSGVAAKTTSGSGNSWRAFHVGSTISNVTFDNILVKDSDAEGIYLGNGEDHTIRDATVEKSDEEGIRVAGVADVQIINPRVESNVSDIGVRPDRDNGQVDNPIITGVGAQGIYSDSADTVINNPQIKNAGNDGIELVGTNQVVSGGSVTGSTQDDINVSSATEAIIEGVYFGSINTGGTRNVINGKGFNSGDPSSSGDWNGNASLAHDLGVTVYDTSVSPSDPYVADDAGNWIKIGS